MKSGKRGRKQGRGEGRRGDEVRRIYADMQSCEKGIGDSSRNGWKKRGGEARGDQDKAGHGRGELNARWLDVGMLE